MVLRPTEQLYEISHDKNFGPNGESNPLSSGWIPAALPLSYWPLYLPYELLKHFILHLTHFTSQHTAHCKLELSISKGLQEWDSIWQSHGNSTASLISQLQLIQTRAHLSPRVNCNQARSWESLYVWHCHFNTILSILKFKCGFMTNWTILRNKPCWVRNYSLGLFHRNLFL